MRVVQFEITDDRVFCATSDIYFSLHLDEYVPRVGDRVALFKVGWEYVGDYVISEEIPTSIYENTFSFGFNKERLPENIKGYFELCYITGEDEVLGTSAKFKINNSTIEVDSSSDDGDGFFEDFLLLLHVLRKISSDYRDIMTHVQTLGSKIDFLLTVLEYQREIIFDLQKNSLKDPKKRNNEYTEEEKRKKFKQCTCGRNS